MHIKSFIKRYLLPLIAINLFQPIYRLLHRLSLIGMNIGPVGEFATSGEARLVRKLMQLAPPNATIFDVGANRGEFSLACCPFLPESSRIFAFEPSPTIYLTLIDNLARAGLTDRVTAVQLGLSDHSGSASIFVNSGFEGCSSLHVRHLTECVEAEPIKLTTLDEFCHNNAVTKLFLVKIDIEGEELACLRGACVFLSLQQVDYITFEFGGCDIQSRVFLKDFWDLLSPHYELFRILQNSVWPWQRYSELDEIFTTTNFLAVRRGLPIP